MNAPNASLRLEHVYGYRGHQCRNNLAFLGESGAEFVYFVAGVGVVFCKATQQQRFFLMHDDDIISLALHGDRRTVATGQIGKAPTIFVWDTASLGVVSILKGEHERGVASLAFGGPDDRMLVSSGLEDYHLIVLWDWKKGQKLASARGGGDRVYDVVFSPHAQAAVVSCGVKHVKFWTLSGNQLAGKKGVFGTAGDSQTQLCIAFGAAHTTITGTLSGAVYVWRGAELARTIANAHDGAIFSLHRHADSFASGSRDGTVKLWDADFAPISTINLAASVVGYAGLTVKSVCRCGDALLAGTQDGEVLEVALVNGSAGALAGPAAVLLCQGHAEGELWALACHSTLGIFATGSDDGTLRLWDMERRAQLGRLVVGLPVRSVALAPAGAPPHVAAGLRDGSFRVFDIAAALADRAAAKDGGGFAYSGGAPATWPLVAQAKHRAEVLHEMKFSPDGKWLAVASNDNFVDLYDAARQYARVGTCSGASSFITHVDFATDSAHLQLNSGAGERLFFTVPSGTRVTKSTEVAAIKYATWTCVQGAEVDGIWPKYSHTDDINALDVAGGLVATGDDFGQVKLFNFPCLKRGAKFKKYVGHSAHVTNVRFAARHARLITTGGADRAIFQWTLHAAPEAAAATDALQGPQTVQVSSSSHATGAAHAAVEGVVHAPLYGSNPPTPKAAVSHGRLSASSAVSLHKVSHGAAHGAAHGAVAVSITPQLDAPTAQYDSQDDDGNVSQGTDVDELDSDVEREKSAVIDRVKDKTDAVQTRVAAKKSKTDTAAPRLQAPEAALRLSYVHGYRGYDCRNNVFVCATGELVYHVAGVGVVLQPSANTQRHYVQHTDDILCLALHPAGAIVATGQIGRLAEIHVWDAATVNIVSVLKGFHTRGVCAVAFSADGKRLASVGLEDDHFVAVWDWKAGALLAQTRGHKDKIFCVKWSPVADTLVTVGVKHIKFWTPAGAGLTGKRGVFGDETKMTTMMCVAHSHDGATVLAGGVNGFMHMFTAATATLRARVQAHDGAVLSLCIVEKGFISGGKDGTVALWDPTFATCVRRYTVQRSVLVVGSAPLMADAPGIRAVALAKGRIFAGTESGELVVLDKDGPCRVVTQGHAEGEVWGLATHPTAAACATVSDDMRLRLWDLHVHALVAIKKLPKKARAVAYSPDGLAVVAGMLDGSVTVLGSADLAEQHKVHHRTEEVSDIKFSPNGRFVAVASHDNFVDIYDTPTMKRVGVCKGASSYITHVDWEAGGKLLQVNTGASELLYFEAPRGERQTPSQAVVAQLRWATWTSVLGPTCKGIWEGAHDVTDVNTAHLARDGVTLATGDDFGLVKLFRYPVAAAAKFKKYLGHSSHVTCVRWTHDSALLVSVGGADTCMAVWENTSAAVGGSGGGGGGGGGGSGGSGGIKAGGGVGVGGTGDSGDSDTDDAEDGYDTDVAAETATDYAALAYKTTVREAAG